MSHLENIKPCKIRVLIIGFENEIRWGELEYFRAAVSDIAGAGHVLFHNHTLKGYRYSYPLIQYQTWGKRPLLVCLNEGVDEVHHFFENRNGKMILGDREYDMKIGRINLNRFTLQTWDKTFRYKIYHWLPLNQDNYQKYKMLDNDIDRAEFLGGILFGNILSFAKGMGWHLDKELLKVRIHDTGTRRMMRVKKVMREAYTLEFSTNVFLPDFIGLGRNVSRGYGLVRPVREKK